MPIHRFPAENIMPIDEKLTIAVSALAEVVNMSEISLMHASNSNDNAWCILVRDRANQILDNTLQLRAYIWSKE